MPFLILGLYSCENVSNTIEESPQEKESFQVIQDTTPQITQLQTKVIDKQGNAYSIISFNNQLWSTSNYLQTVFNNGDKIREAKNESDWFDASQNKEPIWSYYDFDSTNKDLYGVYYNWYAINDERGLTPEGWFFPPNQQAHIFARELKFDAHHLKERSYWETERFIYNSTGFSARPGGLIAINGEFREVGERAYFWTNTEKNPYNAMYFELSDGFNSIYFSDLPKQLGMNIRLFKRIQP